jgi:hypothetical protein
MKILDGWILVGGDEEKKRNLRGWKKRKRRNLWGRVSEI